MKKLKIVNKFRFTCSIIILIALCATIVFLITKKSSPQTIKTGLSEEDFVKEETPVKEDININMSVIGDIMCHDSQYKDAYLSSQDTYDFSYVF